MNTQSKKEGLSVLIPVDFSRGTEDWVRQGLSRLSNVAKVRLLYVIPLNLSELGDFLTEDVVEEGEEDAHQAEDERPEALGREYSGRGPCPRFITRPA